MNPSRSPFPAVSGNGQSSDKAPLTPLRRISSEDLLRQERAVEIEHNGRVYQLRVTHMNKLILTA